MTDNYAVYIYVTIELHTFVCIPTENCSASSRWCLQYTRTWNLTSVNQSINQSHLLGRQLPVITGAVKVT